MQKVREGVVYSGAPGGETQSAIFPIPCVTDSGRWLCAFRAAPAKGPLEGQQVLLTWSDNNGKTWQGPAVPFAAPAHNGRAGSLRFAGITDLGRGHLLAALSWVDGSRPGAPYFNEATEGLLDTRILIAESLDSGETWSDLQVLETPAFPVPTPLTGPILRLADGTWCCQFELNKHYDDLTAWHHASILLFSRDEGHSWNRHEIVAQDPEGRIFYWDQRPSVLPDGRLLDVFWTFDREACQYLNIHARVSENGGHTWSPLWDTGVPGQPGPVFALADGALGMPVVDRSVQPVIRVHRSTDGGRTWPSEDTLMVYERAGRQDWEDKRSMQDAWNEMSAFSVGLPSTAPLPGGGALLVYYAGAETDRTAIHWAVIK